MDLEDAKSLGETLQSDRYKDLSDLDASVLLNTPYRTTFHEVRPQNYFNSTRLSSSRVLGVMASAAILSEIKRRSESGSGQHAEGSPELAIERATYGEIIEMLRGAGMNAGDQAVSEMITQLVADPSFPLSQEQANRILDLAYDMKIDSMDAMEGEASQEDVAISRQVYRSTQNLLQAIASLNSNYTVSVNAILAWNGSSPIPPAYTT